MKNLIILTLALVLFYAAASPAFAQEQPKPQPTEQPTAEEVEKEKLDDFVGHHGHDHGA